MKIFISVDIGGTCGSLGYEEYHFDEVEMNKQVEIMNKELQAVCQAINDIDNQCEITIKDSFGEGNGIDPRGLPTNTSIIRGWDGGPLGTMQGIDKTYDMSFLVGYDLQTYTRTTSGQGRLDRYMTDLKINGVQASEFLISYYTSLYHGVPVKFVSGDKSLCDMVEVMDSGINTVYTVKRVGASVIADTPDFVNELIYKEAQRALHSVTPVNLELPKSFEVEIEYDEAFRAYRACYYSGVQPVDPRRVRFETDDFMEVLKLLMFV